MLRNYHNYNDITITTVAKIVLIPYAIHSITLETAIN
jgi:hypothetical protein